MHKLGTEVKITPVQPPCKNCSNRYPGCHSACVEFSIFRGKVEDYKKQRKAVKQKYADLLGSDERRSKWQKNR